jgi:hypothetical protein
MTDRISEAMDGYAATRSRIRQLSFVHDDLLWQIFNKTTNNSDLSEEETDDHLLYIMARLIGKVRVSTLSKIGLLPASEILGQRYFTGRKS